MKVEICIPTKLQDSIYLKQTLVLYFPALRMDSARISLHSSQLKDIDSVVESMYFQANKLGMIRLFTPKKMIHQCNISTKKWLKMLKWFKINIWISLKRGTH